MTANSDARSAPSDEAATPPTADQMFAARGCCCFPVPWSDGRKAWERIRHPTSAERGEDGGDGRELTVGQLLWSKGKQALTKVREWSEVVAGPRWKTLLRRLGRRGRNGGNGGGGRPGGRFGYDPFSYALNFDEGNGPDDDSDGDGTHRGFSSRYAVPPVSAKSSMDLGSQDAPSLFAADAAEAR